MLLHWGIEYEYCVQVRNTSESAFDHTAKQLNVEVAVLSAEDYYASITYVKKAPMAKPVNQADRIFSVAQSQWAQWYHLLTVKITIEIVC